MTEQELKAENDRLRGELAELKIKQEAERGRVWSLDDVNNFAKLTDPEKLALRNYIAKVSAESTLGS